MHILSHGQGEHVALLVGVHDVLVVIQSQRVTLGIIERQVHVVGEVGEDVLQVFTQVGSQRRVCFQAKLGMQLSGEIRHQAQLVVHLIVLGAVFQRIVD